MPMIMQTDGRGDPVLINSDWIMLATRVSRELRETRSS